VLTEEGVEEEKDGVVGRQAQLAHVTADPEMGGAVHQLEEGVDAVDKVAQAAPGEQRRHVVVAHQAALGRGGQLAHEALRARQVAEARVAQRRPVGERARHHVTRAVAEQFGRPQHRVARVGQRLVQRRVPVGQADRAVLRAQRHLHVLQHLAVVGQEGGAEVRLGRVLGRVVHDD